MTLMAVDIIWDKDETDSTVLPNYVIIPDGMEDDEDISDYITEKVGYCHCGFDLKEVDEVKSMVWDKTKEREDAWGTLDNVCATIRQMKTNAVMMQNTDDEELLSVLEYVEDALLEAHKTIMGLIE